ncbi:hypothetical protein FQA39_LY07180 [Lamprigera yunnana]|nr:hypothetical protein FQA39_LY07180 [Lamprigera yunnana]
MSRRVLSYEKLLKELEDLPQYESDCELPSNNNTTDEDSVFVIDVPESQKSRSDLDEITPPLSTLTRRNSNTDIAIRDGVNTFLDKAKFPSVSLHLGAITMFDTDSCENNTVEAGKVKQSIDLPWSIPEDYDANN